jgi:hypothetical protein
MTVDQRLDRLTGVVQALVPNAVMRAGRIERLVQMTEKHEQEMKDLVLECQAYLRTLPQQ